MVMSPGYCSHLFISIACPWLDEASSRSWCHLDIAHTCSFLLLVLHQTRPAAPGAHRGGVQHSSRANPGSSADRRQRGLRQQGALPPVRGPASGKLWSLRQRVSKGTFFFFKLPWERFVADHLNYHDDSGKCAMRQCGHFSSLLPPWPCGKELLGKHKQQESNAIRDLTTSMYAYSVKTQVFHQQWVVGWALMGCVSLMPLQSHYKSLLENISSERKIASGIWQLLR